MKHLLFIALALMTAACAKPEGKKGEHRVVHSLRVEKSVFSEWDYETARLDLRSSRFGQTALTIMVDTQQGCSCTGIIRGNETQGVMRIDACASLGSFGQCSAFEDTFYYYRTNAGLAVCDMNEDCTEYN